MNHLDVEIEMFTQLKLVAKPTHKHERTVQTYYRYRFWAENDDFNFSTVDKQMVNNSSYDRSKQLYWEEKSVLECRSEMTYFSYEIG